MRRQGPKERRHRYSKLVPVADSCWRVRGGRAGGLILAHNVQYASDYLELVTANAALDTVRLTQASGLSATLKKR
jgi:hypothetical protein